ncbi:molecular chaperone [Enterobacteriaceae bacterium LUAb1]
MDKFSMIRTGKTLVALLTIQLCIDPLAGYAGLSLDTTRLVIPQQTGETMFRVINSSVDTAYLVNTRLSQTLSGREPVSNILVSPPLFRLDPDSKNAVRVRVLNRCGLPINKESLFFLTINGVPGSPAPLRHIATREASASGKISTGVGFIIKAVYRPSALSAPTMNTYKELFFSRVPGGIQLINPTPYYVALGMVSIDGHPVQTKHNVTDLLAPFARQFYGTDSTLKKQASFSIYDDAGRLQELTATIQ